MPTVHDTAYGGDDGRLRFWDRWQLVIQLPTAAERLVERDVPKHDHLVGNGLLVLKYEILALRIEHVEKIGYAAVVTLHCEVNGVVARI